ncbi:MAG: hypothetical protein QNJ19_15540 [Woeseiaceae bacterium]|nr:hypothetical protein [Woeseiaceae bacterium]
MQITDAQREDISRDLLEMYLATLATVQGFQLIPLHFFPERGDLVGPAISEFLRDFTTEEMGDLAEFFRGLTEFPRAPRREDLVRFIEANPVRLQNAGFYGDQLELKKAVVMERNRQMMSAISQIGDEEARPSGLFVWSIKKWIKTINNFLFSLVKAIGVGEALKELKDFVAEEIPETHD